MEAGTENSPGAVALRVLVGIVNVLKTILIALGMLVYHGVRACLPASVLPKKSVAGEIVLMTGGGSGIGRLVAKRLAQLGARIVLWDINEQGNQETAQQIKSLGGEAYPYKVDISSREEIYKAAEKVKREIGDVSILINNAGIVTGRKFMDCPDDLVVKTMQVNTHAHFWTMKAFLPKMLERNHGHVVEIASAAGLMGTAGLMDYCASKFAVVGICDSLQVELDAMGKDGVHVTCVCPYWINTGMFDGVKSAFPRILPILEPDYVASKIVDAIQLNQYILLLPRILYSFYFLHGLLPTRVGLFLLDCFKINHAMDSYTGRKKKT